MVKALLVLQTLSFVNLASLCIQFSHFSYFKSIDLENLTLMQELYEQIRLLMRAGPETVDTVEHNRLKVETPPISFPRFHI